MSGPFYDEMTEYLALRKKVLAPGSFQFDQRVAQSFAQHMEQYSPEEKCVTEEHVISWIQPWYENHSRKTIENSVGFLRMFLKYLQYKGIPTYMPPYPSVPENYVPYLFSEDEIKKIFSAADNMPPRKNGLEFELPMLLRMLYSCGFRVGELLAAKTGDVNFDRGVILLRDTKNRRQRIVPLGDELSRMLYRYCLAMNLLSVPDMYLFPGVDRTKHLANATLDSWFKEILKSTGIYTQPPKHTRGQCLHCFRHLFTVKAFAKAEKEGRPVTDSIPFLSVYLGHFDMNATEKYLKFSSDMFPEYTNMFEDFTDGIFPEVQYEE